MLASSKAAKELLTKLRGTKPGDSIYLPSIIPAVQDDVQALVTVNEDNEYWVLEAFWHGIRMGEISAEVRGADLLLEQL